MTPPADRPDLLVAGAGPAGIAAAIRAAAAGLSVVAFDQATFPRDKTCGDGLTTAALRHLEALGLDLAALTDELVPVDDVVVVSPSGRHVELPLPRDGGLHAAVVPRVRLDEALVELARKRGVVVREGAAVSGVTTGSEAVTVTLADGSTIEAPFLVAADGHWSAVRRSLHPGAPADLGEWHAVRQYFRDVETRRLWVIFEPDLLPGYAWVFPLPGGRANVGFGVLRSDGRSGKEHKALWPELLQRPSLRKVLGPHAEPEESVRAWPIPSRFDPAHLTDGRVLYAGDAAGVVDPLTGEGVAQAIETGLLAADAVSGGGSGPAVADRYRRSVQGSLGLDLRFASMLRAVMARELGARGAIRVAGLTAWTRRNFARWMFEDYPRAVVFTPRRWRRGVMTGPGAYR